VFHCFSGSAEDAERYLAFENFFLGVNGSFTYKKSVLPEVFKQTVPLNRVVLETDSPYLAPVPHRGRRNESAYLVDVARKVAEVYGTDLEQISVVTTRNAQILYGVDKS
jgi:TatD DNase family protein